MERPLFVYGSLCDSDLCAAVLGRAIDRRNVLAATAPGFRALVYGQGIYPALARSPGGRADGLIILGITPFERDLLDAWEGPAYRREIVPVIVDEELHEADAYMATRAIAAGAEEWSLPRWQANHKATMLVAEANAARDLRARLIAVRPN